MPLLNFKLQIKMTALLQVITGLIASLFFYASLSKLMDFDKSQWEMRNQIFPAPMAMVMVWLIPAIEFTLIPLLLFPTTRKKALWASFVLLSAFTLYIAIVMTGVFGRVPCSCGGILENMPYSIHLIFNLFFVALASLGLAIDNGWISYNRLFNLKKERIP